MLNFRCEMTLNQRAELIADRARLVRGGVRWQRIHDAALAQLSEVEANAAEDAHNLATSSAQPKGDEP